MLIRQFFQYCCTPRGGAKSGYWSQYVDCTLNPWKKWSAQRTHWTLFFLYSWLTFVFLFRFTGRLRLSGSLLRTWTVRSSSTMSISSSKPSTPRTSILWLSLSRCSSLFHRSTSSVWSQTAGCVSALIKKCHSFTSQSCQHFNSCLFLLFFPKPARLNSQYLSVTLSYQRSTPHPLSCWTCSLFLSLPSGTLPLRRSTRTSSPSSTPFRHKVETTCCSP